MKAILFFTLLISMSLSANEGSSGSFVINPNFSYINSHTNAIGGSLSLGRLKPGKNYTGAEASLLSSGLNGGGGVAAFAYKVITPKNSHICFGGKAGFIGISSGGFSIMGVTSEEITSNHFIAPSIKIVAGTRRVRFIHSFDLWLGDTTAPLLQTGFAFLI